MKTTDYLTLVLILSILILQSCTTFKNIPTRPANRITKENLAEIDALYLNQPVENREISFQRSAGPGCIPTALWENMYGCLNNKRNRDTTFGTVKIEFVTPRKIRLTLIQPNEPKQSKVLKGRIKNGHFYGRQRFIIYPFFPLFFGYSSYRYRIGITENGIIMDSKWGYWGFALFGGGDGRGEYQTKYGKY